MSDARRQRGSCNKRRAKETGRGAHRPEVANDVRRRRYADDAEFRARCQRSSRNSRLKKQHGITLDELEAQLAAQHGNCACCKKKLGRVKRVHFRRDGRMGLLCASCCRLVAGLRHVRDHVRAFEAFFKEWGMTIQLERLHEVMRIWGLAPAPSEGGGRPT
jgi:hypothetical protein